MKSVGLSYFACAAVCSLLTTGARGTTPEVTPHSFARAAAELRSYCIERVCLGTTPQAVSKLGQLEWDQTSGPTGALTCSEYGNESKATLTTEDGKKFTLLFELVESNGPPAARYRLTSAAITLPELSSLQVDGLMESLRTRVGAHTKGSSLHGSWYRTTENKEFLINVEKSTVSSVGPHRDRAPLASIFGDWQVRLAGTYLLKKQWLLTRPECLHGLPKL